MCVGLSVAKIPALAVRSLAFLFHAEGDLTDPSSRGGRTPSCPLLWNHFSEGTTEGVVENGLRHSSDWGYSA